MKIIKYLITITILATCLLAQETFVPLAEKIKEVSVNLLEGYTQPLITSFGTGVSTGLFHSAASHKTLGFDFGVRLMYIQVPGFAKYFKNAEVVVCSLANGTIEYDSLTLDSASTIFGPKERTDVPAPGNAVGIPPFIPGGFNLSGVLLIMPQLNIGLIMGSELTLRYVPVTFKGSSVNFLGVGIKQNLNQLPFMKAVPLPLDLAIGGAIQDFSIQDSFGVSIVTSRTWNLQILASKNLVAFEPFIGVGLEGTKVYFHYDFEYEIPDTSGAPGDRITLSDEINVELIAQNDYRAMLGFTLKIALFYLHYDYNFVPHYKTHNLIAGFTFR